MSREITLLQHFDRAWTGLHLLLLPWHREKAAREGDNLWHIKRIPPWLKGAIPAWLVGGGQPWVRKRELGEGYALVDGGREDPSWNATSPRLHHPCSLLHVMFGGCDSLEKRVQGV